jgi:hypothetical protein
MQGGIIAGNTGETGGGVAVLDGTFTKAPLIMGNASGIIYGSNGGVDRNTAALGVSNQLNDQGDAVYISGTMRRETTVLPGQTLDSAVAGTPGGWVD